MAYKLKNLKPHYQNLQWKNKHFYSFQEGEIKEVNPEILPDVNRENFEVIDETKSDQKSPEVTEKAPKKATRKRSRKKR